MNKYNLKTISLIKDRSQELVLRTKYEDGKAEKVLETQIDIFSKLRTRDCEAENEKRRRV